MKDRSLKSQFRLTIILILASSLLATIITYAIAVFIFIQLEYNSIYPANYYEKQLPDIETYIRKQGTALVDPVAKDELERLIPLEGVDYQVLDAKGEVLYGSVAGSYVDHPGEVYGRLNTTFSSRGKLVRAVPIFGEQGEYGGAALLAYELQVSSAGSGGRLWIVVLFIAVFVAPFVYLILFTILFSRRFARRVNEPLQMLVEASNQIKNRNLDFELGYRSGNELGQLCAAFSDMKDELESSLSAQWRLEEERRSMTEALAHDLKTPLSLILGYAEALIGDEELGGSMKRARYLTIIKENAEKSSALVRQMLYISDLESSGPELAPVSVRIGPFIQEKLSHFELLAKQKGIRIVSDLRGDSEAIVRFDTDKVERILHNVVSNSLEYTPEGGSVRVSVSVEPNRVAYEICNTGPPFTGRDLERMFQKFYRGEEARGGKGSHSGLGLYIVKMLTEKLGGSVRAYNSEAGEACIAFSHAVETG